VKFLVTRLWIAEDSILRPCRLLHCGRKYFRSDLTPRHSTLQLFQEEWGVKVQSPTLLHGRWLLRQDTYGEVADCAFYTRHGGMPGHHAVLRFHPHEEEQEEVFKRFRPKSFTEVRDPEFRV